MCGLLAGDRPTSSVEGIVGLTLVYIHNDNAGWAGHVCAQQGERGVEWSGVGGYANKKYSRLWREYISIPRSDGGGALPAVHICLFFPTLRYLK